MVELEREYTFLMSELPSDLAGFPSKIIEDNYIPAELSRKYDHSPIKNVEKYEEKG